MYRFVLLYCQVAVFVILLSTTALAQEARLIATYPIDDGVFIQGLTLDGEGRLLYSSGLYGQSEIGYLPLSSLGRVVVDRLPETYFGEGVAVTPDGVWQLSWREETAFFRDKHTLVPIATAHYVGEGWGLSYDSWQDRLWLSNGSNTLQYFHPKTFAKQGGIQVYHQGVALGMLNELEFANGFIYANVWNTNHIAKIDPKSGEVLRLYDLTPLVASLTLTDPNDVLNGIAHLNDDRFLVTGKRFSVVWEVVLP